MIGPDSRYQNAVVQTVLGPDKETRQEMRVRFPTSRQISYTYYRVQAGERVDNIAHAFYGDGRRWWMIADANPEILEWFPTTDPTGADVNYGLAAGDIIRVPNG